MKQKRGASSRWEKGCVLFAGFGVVSTATVIVASLFSFFMSQVHLARFADTLFSYPLPPQTIVISREADVGVLVGNGSHCDFRAVLRLQTPLDTQGILDHYADVTFPPVDKDSTATVMAGLNGRLSVYVQRDPETNDVFVTLFDYSDLRFINCS